MNPYPNLDVATSVFIEGFKRELAPTQDLSNQFDHQHKKLKASGAFSSVYITRWIQDGSRPKEVCYKELHPPASDTHERRDLVLKTIRHLTREVKIWRDLDHPNIVKFLGYVIEGEGCQMKAALVSDWCANGNIVEYLRQYPESNKITLIQDIAEGLKYLHDQSPPVIHGDLKPQNVVVDSHGTAQLCDFGLSRLMRGLSGPHQTTSTANGYTMRYSPHEVMVEEVKSDKSDVYAFGCTCIHILFGKYPFPDLREYQVSGAIEKRKRPWEWNTSIPLEHILSGCCGPQQETRPSIDSVLQQLNVMVTVETEIFMLEQDLSEEVENEIVGHDINVMRVPLDSWSGLPPQFTSPMVLSGNSQQPQTQLQPQPAPQRQQRVIAGSSQVTPSILHLQPPHQPPQPPVPTNVALPPPMIVAQKLPTALLTDKALFMRTLSEIFHKKNLTGEDIPKPGGVRLDLFALFNEVVLQGGRNVVGQAPGGWGRIESKYGVFRIQDMYIKLLGDLEDGLGKAIALVQQRQARGLARQMGVSQQDGIGLPLMQQQNGYSVRQQASPSLGRVSETQQHVAFCPPPGFVMTPSLAMSLPSWPGTTNPTEGRVPAPQPPVVPPKGKPQPPVKQRASKIPNQRWPAPMRLSASASLLAAAKSKPGPSTLTEQLFQSTSLKRPREEEHGAQNSTEDHSFPKWLRSESVPRPRTFETRILAEQAGHETLESPTAYFREAYQTNGSPPMEMPGSNPNDGITTGEQLTMLEELLQQIQTLTGQTQAGHHHHSDLPGESSSTLQMARAGPVKEFSGFLDVSFPLGGTILSDEKDGSNVQDLPRSSDMPDLIVAHSREPTPNSVLEPASPAVLSANPQQTQIQQQPPTHLTGSQVSNMASMQKREEEAKQLKTMLKAQVQACSRTHSNETIESATAFFEKAHQTYGISPLSEFDSDDDMTADEESTMLEELLQQIHHYPPDFPGPSSSTLQTEKAA